MSDYNAAAAMNLPAPNTVEEAVRQRDGWLNAAAMHHRNEEYYRGLVDRIGIACGADAYTADDGVVHDSILRAKVPELAIQRISAASFLFNLLDDIDTAEDIAKSDDSMFRAIVHKLQRRRFEVAETDGYTVAFKDRVSGAGRVK